MHHMEFRLQPHGQPATAGVQARRFWLLLPEALQVGPGRRDVRAEDEASEWVRVVERVLWSTAAITTAATATAATTTTTRGAAATAATSVVHVPG